MIYLDNSATMPQSYYLRDVVLGNANSPHGLGVEANRALQQCRDRVKKVLNVNGGKIIFGGTASMLVNRMVDYIGPIDFTSSVDHDCVFKCGDECLNEADLNQLDDYDFSDLTIAHIHTNNITGQIYNLRALGKKVKKDGGYFIMDAVATFGHATIPIDIELWCDCLISSAHKYGGPQGTGFMWVSDRFADNIGLNKSPNDEYGFWPGTPAITNIIPMVNALEDANKCLEAKSSYWYGLTNYLLTKLKEYNIIAKLVDGDKTKTYAINAVTIDGIDSDSLVRYLSGLDIYISPGHSACEENSDYRILKQCGLTEEECKSTIRISFGPSTIEEDIATLVNGIVEYKKLFIYSYK